MSDLLLAHKTRVASIACCRHAKLFIWEQVLVHFLSELIAARFCFMCRIRSKSSAVKIGSETLYEMGNLSFVNMTIVASHRGLAIQARDQGTCGNT